MTTSRDAAGLCQASLEHWLGTQGKTLTVIEPETPQAMVHAAQTLLDPPLDPARGAIWVAGLPTGAGADRADWWQGWRRLAVALNHHRETLRTRVRVPVLLVGPEELGAIMREIAFDVWSMRAMAAWIMGAASPGDERDLRLEHTRIDPPRARRSQGVYDYAHRMVARLRGKPGQERALASQLMVTADAHRIVGDWRAAEAALTEAAALLAEDGDPADQFAAWFLLGEARKACARLGDALAAYRAGLAIAERLAGADRDNAGWQRDLSVSHERIGDVLRAQGDLAGAQGSYHACLVIRERLAGADRDNAEWQRDLFVSHTKVGDVLRAQGDLAGALAAYRAGLAIAERLAGADRDNAGWQRDLSVWHNKIGDVLRAQGNLAGALASYRAGLAIAERLAGADRDNAGWQGDLAASHGKLGLTLTAQGERDQARRHFETGRAIVAGLVARSPDHAQWRQYLAGFERGLAALQQ